MKIAVLDDDPLQVEAIRAVVEKAGFRSTPFSRANALISALRRDTFDLLIVDWQLPDRSGLEVLAWARMNLVPTPPMLLVTSRADDEDIVTGLDAGADDYLSKPVSSEVLEARVRALLRRAYARPAAPGPESYDGVLFDPATTTVTRAEEAVVLTAKEFALAQLLFRNLNRALSRAYMVEAVWGSEPTLTSRSLDMHISRVRSKLGLRPENGFHLRPVYSYGYRLERVGGDGEEAA